MFDSFMKEAIEEAKLAAALEEVPIGAVIVKDGIIIARGHNLRNTRKNPLNHGEITAINQAAQVVGDWRLEGCTIFVTVEPCPMCAGAIVTARMDRVVFGARNPKAGCGGSIINLFQQPGFNHRVEVVEGILEKECRELMQQFFKRLRL